MARVDKHFLEHLQADYSVRDKSKNINASIAYMLNRSNVMFHYEGLPETIPHTELEKMLQTNGFAVFCKINDEFYVVNAGLGGEGDTYNRPTQAVVSVPYLKYNATLEIDKDCIVIMNDTHGMGLLPIYAKGSTFLCENDITIMLTLINKRSQTVFSANDDNTVESAKDYIKNLEDGKIGVIAEQRLFDSLKVHTSTNGANNHVNDLIELNQYIKASMFNEIGLNANFNMKRERLNSSEVELNSDALYPLIDNMLQMRREAIDKINTMFGLSIKVDFASSWEYRINSGESIDAEIGEDVAMIGENNGSIDGENVEENNASTDTEIDSENVVATDDETDTATDEEQEVEEEEQDSTTAETEPTTDEETDTANDTPDEEEATEGETEPTSGDETEGEEEAETETEEVAEEEQASTDEEETEGETETKNDEKRGA